MALRDMDECGGGAAENRGDDAVGKSCLEETEQRCCDASVL